MRKVFDYDCNVKGKIDLAIYEYEEARVIFETKSVVNKGEFVKPNSNSLESKAFYESILYFLRENIINKNNNITFIILATAEVFYIIDAREYLNNFSKNKDILKAFKNCQEKKGTDSSAPKFYEEIANILPEIESEISYLRVDFKKILDKDKLGLLYILLSPQVLLKRTAYIDANTLNQEFYNELLYILGLEESEETGKITYSEIENTFYDSISKTFKLDKDNDFEDIFSLLITWNNRILFLRLLESMLIDFEHIKNPFLDLEYLPDFNNLNILFFEVLAKKENERANISKKLEIIPYLNSSLFEKKEFERSGNEIKFLQSNNLKIYRHSILKRDKNLKVEYLKNNKTEELPLLKYLFLFLHAYDFTTTSKDLQNNVKINYDKLINSAVLGLVFEKLNGYKDGSFYTPSFITNYMCKQSLEKIVLNKFNEEQYKAKNLSELYNAITDIKEANRIFNEIRICDPAVGSGHFLVSALNELLLIKDKLGLLIDDEGKRLKDIKLELKDDEIVIKDSENNIHNYKRPKHENTEAHNIQRTIFFAKKEIIENNLFGVDINPNSCEITKLRLWIELLKYSYYKDIQNKYLETLPNIDINIKCGNSLISYFEINQSLNSYPKIQDKISEYKELVKNYKNGVYKSKNEIDEKIKELLESFRKFCLNYKYPYQTKEFDRLCKEYNEKYGNYLVKDNKDFKEYFSQGILLVSQFDEMEAKKDYEILIEKYNDIFDLEAMLPFEWKFAFSEVLDYEGNFIGFDLIIGNPPYIRQEKIKELKPKLQELFSIYCGTADLYTYFFELGLRVLKPNGILSLITSNKFCRANYGAKLREYLLKHSIISFIDLNGIKVFESATVDTSIITIAKSTPTKAHKICYDNPKSLEFSLKEIPQSALNKDAFTFGDSATLDLKAKIEKLGTPLKDWGVSIYRGVITGYNEAFIITTAQKDNILNSCKDDDERTRTQNLIKPVLRGRDIKRYSYKWADLWVIGTFPALRLDINDYPALKEYLLDFMPRIAQSGEKGCRKKTNNKWFETQDNIAYWQDFEREKIVYSEIVREPQFYFDKGEFYAEATSFIMTGENLKYLLGLLNSKFVAFVFKSFYAGGGLGNEGYRYKKQFIEKLPIPRITNNNKSIATQITQKVEAILSLKKSCHIKRSEISQKDSNCHIERSEISQKDSKRDSSASPQNDKENDKIAQLECEIDELVYQLYGLTEEEVKIIENRNNEL